MFVFLGGVIGISASWNRSFLGADRTELTVVGGYTHLPALKEKESSTYERKKKQGVIRFIFEFYRSSKYGDQVCTSVQSLGVCQYDSREVPLDTVYVRKY